ncbi:hypothetical protein B0H17DRAFT_1195364 [Mycena rosella]|uniref:Uncharacterized protein n=1 Tax=Mycena rosella TaxID=1033263 RepID=A0AAD7DXZ4_MYCRO|nr:hypothetical protein B0H17DRAFT_1195364 [Mycena rosella]
MSPPLTAIFDIPTSAPVADKDGKVGPAEGTEANPIVLAGVTVAEFDDFMSYFFKFALIPIDKVPANRREKICVNLMMVACLWDIAEAKVYAKEVLEGLKLPAARMLELARKFAIHEWVEDAVKQLIPLCGTFDSDVALQLGPITMSILYQAKTELDLERMYVAHTAPKLSTIGQLAHGTCNRHRDCEKAVKAGRWIYIGKKVLHPTKPMALADIGEHLNTFIFPGMSRKCHEDMMNDWTTNTFQQESLIESAVAGVTAFHKCCRIS